MTAMSGCVICARPVVARQLCAAHYARARLTGDPRPDVPVRTSPGAARRYFEQAMSSETDECIPWPFSTNGRGYGKIGVGRERRYVHILACEREHGPCPVPGWTASHLCEGCTCCINRRHLVWEDRVANMARAVPRRGEQVPGHKLTAPDVLEIRASALGVHEVARRYGVSASTIRGVRLRHTWAWVP